MKILAINGSPKGANGNTYIMVEEFFRGAQNAGAETEHILLEDKKIHHCIGCLSCWIKTPGVCVFNDDMAELLPKLRPDILVFATPVYVDNVTGLMKNFLDRIIAGASPHFELDEKGETRHITKHERHPKIVVISNCGFAEQTHFQVISHYFNRVARNMHTEVIAEIYRGEGELLHNRNLLLRPILYKYKKLLQKCGREVVENGSLCGETRASLEKPLIPYEMYNKEVNKHWDRELAKISKG